MFAFYCFAFIPDEENDNADERRHNGNDEALSLELKLKSKHSVSRYRRHSKSRLRLSVQLLGRHPSERIFSFNKTGDDTAFRFVFEFLFFFL